MEPATFVMIAALPIMLVFGALALWLTQRPARAVAAPSSANDVVSEGLNIRATMIYLEADGKLLGLAVQIQRLHGCRRNADVLLTGFDAFDERHGRARLFDLARIMTLVDADSASWSSARPRISPSAPASCSATPTGPPRRSSPRAGPSCPVRARRRAR